MSEGHPEGPGKESQVSFDDIPIILSNRKHLVSHAQVTLNETEEQELNDMRKVIINSLKQHKLTKDRAPAAGWKAGQEGMAGASAGGLLQKIKDKAREGGLAGPDGPGGPGGPGGRPDRPGRPQSSYAQEEGCGVRVTNLSERMVDADIHDLFGPCGRIKRVFLARDKKTNKAKGFAYVTFERKQDAERAVHALHKYAYDHVILNVELSKSDKDK